MVPEFNRRDFYGVVMLKDWMRLPDGRQYIGFTGEISILSDEEVIGFRVKGGESNWVARVEGRSGISWTILGCQVRAVMAIPREVHAGHAEGADFYEVP